MTCPKSHSKVIGQAGTSLPPPAQGFSNWHLWDELDPGVLPKTSYSESFPVYREKKINLKRGIFLILGSMYTLKKKDTLSYRHDSYIFFHQFAFVLWNYVCLNVIVVYEEHHDLTIL